MIVDTRNQLGNTVSSQDLLTHPNVATLLYLTSREYLQVQDQVVMSCELSLQTLKYILEKVKPQVYLNHHLAVTGVTGLEWPSNLSLKIYLGESTLQHIVEQQSISAFEHLLLDSEHRLMPIKPNCHEAECTLEKRLVQRSYVANLNETLEKELPLPDMTKSPVTVKIHFVAERPSAVELVQSYETENELTVEKRIQHQAVAKIPTNQSPQVDERMTFEQSSAFVCTPMVSLSGKVKLEEQMPLIISQTLSDDHFERLSQEKPQRKEAQPEVESNELIATCYDQVELETEKPYTVEKLLAEQSIERSVPATPASVGETSWVQLLEQIGLLSDLPAGQQARVADLVRSQLHATAFTASVYEREQLTQVDQANQVNAMLDLICSNVVNQTQQTSFETFDKFHAKVDFRRAQRRSIEQKNRVGQLAQQSLLDKEISFHVQPKVVAFVERRLEQPINQLSEQYWQQLLSVEQRFERTLRTGK